MYSVYKISWKGPMLTVALLGILFTLAGCTSAATVTPDNASGDRSEAAGGSTGSGGGIIDDPLGSDGDSIGDPTEGPGNAIDSPAGDPDGIGEADTSGSISAPWPTETTRTFTEIDESYFFMYMVVFPASAKAPQSKTEILNYPNVKKRSMPLSRLRFALGSEGSAERTYFVDADVQLSLIGNRYVVVHPTTVNPPEDAFNGLTLFYMPGSIGLAELAGMATESTNPTLKTMQVVNAGAAFLKPGTDYVVYWMADYYLDGSEEINSMPFTTHVLEKVPDASSPDPGPDAGGWEWARAAWGDDFIDYNSSYTLTALYKNGAGPLQYEKLLAKDDSSSYSAHEGVLSDVMARVGEPAFVNLSKIYRRINIGLLQVVVYDGNPQTIFINQAKNAQEAGEVQIDVKDLYATTPQFVIGTPPAGEPSTAIYYDSMEWFKLIVPTDSTAKGYAGSSPWTTEPEAKWRSGEIWNGLTDQANTERSYNFKAYKAPPDSTDSTAVYFH